MHSKHARNITPLEQQRLQGISLEIDLSALALFRVSENHICPVAGLLFIFNQLNQSEARELNVMCLRKVEIIIQRTNKPFTNSRLKQLKNRLTRIKINLIDTRITKFLNA